MPQVAADYITRALRETLDTVVSPELRDRLIGSALQSASMNRLPVHPTLFRQFVEGPLRECVLRTLGAELGGSLMNELSSVVIAAERDWAVRSSRRPGIETGSPAAHSRTPASAGAPDEAARPGPTLASRGNTNRRPITPPFELDPPDASPRQQQELRRTEPYDDERRAPTQPAPYSATGEPTAAFQQLPARHGQCARRDRHRFGRARQQQAHAAGPGRKHQLRSGAQLRRLARSASHGAACEQRAGAARGPGARERASRGDRARRARAVAATAVAGRRSPTSCRRARGSSCGASAPTSTRRCWSSPAASPSGSCAAPSRRPAKSSRSARD